LFNFVLFFCSFSLIQSSWHGKFSLRILLKFFFDVERRVVKNGDGDVERVEKKS